MDRYIHIEIIACTMLQLQLHNRDKLKAIYNGLCFHNARQTKGRGLNYTLKAIATMLNTLYIWVITWDSHVYWECTYTKVYPTPQNILRIKSEKSLRSLMCEVLPIQRHREQCLKLPPNTRLQCAKLEEMFSTYMCTSWYVMTWNIRLTMKYGIKPTLTYNDIMICLILIKLVKYDKHTKWYIHYPVT